MMEDYKLVTGVRIILNKKFPPGMIKPHYYLNEITRSVEVDEIEASETIYNELKKRYGKYDDTTSQP